MIKHRPVYIEKKIYGCNFTQRMISHYEIVPPEEITVEEFNQLDEEKQRLYILEHEEFRRWVER